MKTRVDLIRFCVAVVIIVLVLSGCEQERNPEEQGGISPWTRSSPEAQNMDSTLLSDMIDAVERGHYGAVHSLLIIRNDHLIVENYFRGYGQNDLHALYSVTKSFTSCLIGQAIEQDRIDSLNTKLLDFFPEYPRDSLKEEITLAHVLSMTAGIQWNELSVTYEDPENDVFGLVMSSDWINFMLTRPMQHPPGTHFNYNSGSSILLSGILKNTTGSTAERYAENNLFSKIGITDWRWDSGPKGITNTGWGLSLRPMDIARLGYLYLNHGKWDSVQVVSASWVAESTSEKILVGTDYRYAYQWWGISNHHPVMSALGSNDMFLAWGYGGQFIVVIPHLNMVIVSTAGNFIGNTDEYIFSLLTNYILPAVKA